MADIYFPPNPTEGEKYTASNGIVYTWTLVQGVGYWSAASSESDTYLKLDGSNSPITGALEVDGLLTADSGVSVTDGGLKITSDAETTINSSGRALQVKYTNTTSQANGFAIDAGVTGSPTVTVFGDETILKYTGSGTYVHS